MVLFLPLVLVLIAQLATLAGISALRKTYDSDFYLPGGDSFGPQGQNRKLYLASFLQLLAWTWYTLWVCQHLGPGFDLFAPGPINPIPLPVLDILPKIWRAAVVGVPVVYLTAMLMIISVGRHLGRFSDLRMTRPDGSEILPMDLMRPLSLAVNCYATLALLVPLLVALTGE